MISKLIPSFNAIYFKILDDIKKILLVCSHGPYNSKKKREKEREKNKVSRITLFYIMSYYITIIFKIACISRGIINGSE